MMWSDPREMSGAVRSFRGAGVEVRYLLIPQLLGSANSYDVQV